ncbi:ATPase family AAA domain-containing protein 5b [Lampris incognitus]|uniref:ATPase family AAA domain-containing protein 5b n=1 Tax=Lampris incognitus TaxID=2546036 RepID=UPI0024B5C893|nr:ATPase family AAA domain-containing protein 5b [Lampris incognitus]
MKTPGDASAGCANAEHRPRSLGIKLAPIFLRASGKVRGEERLDRFVGKRTSVRDSCTGPSGHGSPEGGGGHGLYPAVFSVTERRRLNHSTSDGLREISESNPAFPVKGVFPVLLKKCHVTSAEGETSHPSSQQLAYDRSATKRKEPSDRDEFDEASKRRRPGSASEDICDQVHRQRFGQSAPSCTAVQAKERHGRSRLSRSHRLRQTQGKGGLGSRRDWRCAPTAHAEPHETHPLASSCSPHTDRDSEDVLWTDKYGPQHSSEVIGNSASVNKLHSWLKKWKLKADSSEMRKQLERTHEENSNDSWDCGDFQGETGLVEERGERHCNTMLLTGPPGVGKTASVYACAQELGFKVFEVNCSSQRSGRNVLSQLREATQSHLVGASDKDPLRPAYFKHFKANGCTAKLDPLPRKSTSSTNTLPTSKKRPAQKLGRPQHKRKPSPATVTLANFFKTKAKADLFLFGGLSSKHPVSKKLHNPSPGSTDEAVSRSKTTAMSLILFEEVDVVFDDDVGFFTAIKTFMKTTKRPVILTTNDPFFRERFDSSLDEIIFKTPPVANVCSYLQLVCLAEDVRMELADITGLLRLSKGDIRRSLLQLQLWVHSGGGQMFQKRVLPTKLAAVHRSSDDELGVYSDSHLPPCSAGCTACMLGLNTVTHQRLLNLLKSWTVSDMNEFLKILAESWRRGAPLLYSNLELLLNVSVGTCGESANNPDEGPPFVLHGKPVPREIKPQIQDAATKINKSAGNSRLSRRKYTSMVLDTKSSPNVILKPDNTSLKATPLRTPSSNDNTEQNANKLATRCLYALTDIVDLMSYLDATAPTPEPHVSGPCRSEEIVWTGAEIKDGFLDEMSKGEEERRCRQEGLLEVQATVEGFGFRQCWRRVSEVWTEAERYRQELEEEKWERLVERLTFPVSSPGKSFNFSFQPPCKPSVVQRRYELSMKALQSRSFSMFGNRRAVCVDYMPTLRSICRCEKTRQQGAPTARSSSYPSIHLGLSKSTVQLLAEDFP